MYVLSHKVREIGFSLVELVIVIVIIVIIGIIAAIAVPRLSRGADEAAEQSIKASLTVMRKATETYAAEHDGVYPAAKTDGINAAGSDEAFPGQLTNYTNSDGLVSVALDRANFPYGPYLSSIPPAPLGPAKGDNRVNVRTKDGLITGNTDPNRAWKYNTVNGQLIFNYKGVSSDGVTQYDEF